MCSHSAYKCGSRLTWDLFFFYRKIVCARIGTLSLLFKVFSLYTNSFFNVMNERFLKVSDVSDPDNQQLVEVKGR